MGRKKKKDDKEPQPASGPAAKPQEIFEARLGPKGTGSVIRVPPPITEAQAIALRQAGVDVVVCGPDKSANSAKAQAIEQAANGPWRRCKPHVNAGPDAMPHYQPDPRGPDGHTFYETDTHKPK
jgi:hypothetical protein